MDAAEDYNILIHFALGEVDVNSVDRDVNSLLYQILVLHNHRPIHVQAVKALLENGATFHRFSIKNISEFLMKLLFADKFDLFTLSLPRLSPDNVIFYRSTGLGSTQLSLYQYCLLENKRYARQCVEADFLTQADIAFIKKQNEQKNL